MIKGVFSSRRPIASAPASRTTAGIFTGYLDDLAATKTTDRRALHENWKAKLPLEKMTAKSEIIRRLADTNGDGSLDESKVFADGFNDVLDGTAAGILAHEGSIYLACIPKLLMLRDTDGDGKADERKTIEEGFGVRVSLSGHDLNGFALGPDGRIYGTIGDRGFSLTTKESVVCEYPNQGAVFRFEPDGTGFEILHTGLRNPKEIAFDALGNPFTVDNNSDQRDAARIVYLVEGGDSGWEMEHQAMSSFHRQIGLKHLPPNRWMEEKIWHLANPDQPAFIVPPIAHLTSGPSGLTYHPGTGFLETEKDRFLICDYRGGAATSGIWSFQMKPDGAGMKLADSHILLRGVAATDAEFSWDGRLFITDFCGGWKSHDQGRLLSLDAGANTWRAMDAASAAKIMREGLEQRSAAELANLLKHPDSRIRLRAQIALTRKPDALKHFSDATISSDFTTRIHGIWGLGILARRGSSPLPVSDFAAIPSLQDPQGCGSQTRRLAHRQERGNPRPNPARPRGCQHRRKHRSRSVRCWRIRRRGCASSPPSSRANAGCPATTARFATCSPKTTTAIRSSATPERSPCNTSRRTPMPSASSAPTHPPPSASRPSSRSAA